MKTGNVPRRFVTRLNSLILVGFFIILAAVVAVPFYTARSSSLSTRGYSQPGANSGAPAKIGKTTSLPASGPTILAPGSSIFMPLSPEPQPFVESIATYDSTCGALQTDFNLGNGVCAKASGVPVTLFPWHVLWIDPAGFVRQSDDAVANDLTEYHYTLPATPTSVVNGQTVDNRGTWKVNLVRSNGAVRQTALFTVHEQNNPVADVFVQKIVRGGDNSVPAGEPIAFLLIVANAGPDTAQNVHLVDSLPSGGTLISFTQQSGPACLPALSNDCTMASLANGERAEFTAIYGTGSISPGTVETTARVTSTTADPDNSNNNSLATFEVTTSSGTPTCTLTCPTGVSFDNDLGTGGHIIHSADFPVPVTTGTGCGSVSTTAVPDPTTHDYFFPIGVSVITASTESGETCTFTVTVNDVEAPTINCPANIARFESSPGSGSATVNYTVTATDNSGTPANPAGSAIVSCDHNSGDSFTLGTTTVHCTATDDGNNSASCNFTVTINADSGCRLTQPDPIVVNSDTNACGTHVSFATPTPVTGNTQCTGPITCDHASGSFFGVGETLVTCSDTTGGTTSFTVNVNDITAPVPNLTPLPTITADCSASAGVPTMVGSKVIFEAPTATDNCGLISGTTADPITYQVPGTYVVHWVYDDGHGNTTNQNQTIVVTTDTSPPVPDVAPLPTVTGECSATVTTVPTATDACTGTVSGTTTDPLTYTTQGDFTITWHYDDGNGHVSTQAQLVKVHDVTPPTISPAPPDVDRSTGAGNTTCTVLVTDAELGTPPTATDNCSVTVTRSGVPAGNQFPVGTTAVVYTARDAGGNERIVIQHVTVHDTTPPTITAPADASYQCVSDVPAASPSQATASDNCGAPSVTVSESNNGGAGSIVSPLVITRTFTATDAGVPANTASAAQTITVTDTIPPTISCPASFTLEPTCPSGAVGTYTTPVGTDNCPGATTTRTAGLASGSVFPIGTTNVTYTVNDAHGNSASCSFTVTVKTVSQTIEDLKTSVNSSSLNGTQKQGLIAKLQAAEDALAIGHTSTACQKLADFINSTQNYIDHGNISAAVGNAWIKTASNVRNTIGCTSNPCT